MEQGFTIHRTDVPRDLKYSFINELKNKNGERYKYKLVMITNGRCTKLNVRSIKEAVPATKGGERSGSLLQGNGAERWKDRDVLTVDKCKKRRNLSVRTKCSREY